MQAGVLGRSAYEQTVLESVSDAVFALDGDGRITLFNRAAEAHFKCQRALVLGRTLREAFPLCADSPFDGHFRRVMETGVPLTFVAPSVVVPGRILEMRVAPLDGGIAATFSDVTERRRAEQALQESEERFRAIAEQAEVGIVVTNLTGQLLFVNDRFCELVGRPRKDVLARTIKELTHPDDWPENARLLRCMAETGNPFTMEKRYLRPDRSWVWVRNTISVRRDAEGTPVGRLAMSMEITDRKRAEAVQQMLIAELQHRTRNLLGVVRSVSSRTLRSSGSLDEFARRFNDRLSALGRVQSLLSKLGDDGVTLRQLVDVELAAHGAGVADGKVTVRGPDVDLPSRAVQVLALALHELATNAVKYGALAQPQARLNVEWNISGERNDRTLAILWVEEAVKLPSPQERLRNGFGLDLINRALPYDLGAETCFGFEDDGVRCEIKVPLHLGSSDFS